MKEIVEKIKDGVRRGIEKGTQIRGQKTTDPIPAKEALAAAKKKLSKLPKLIAEAKAAGETRVLIWEMKHYTGSDGFSDNDWQNETLDALCCLCEESGLKVRFELDKYPGFANVFIIFPA